MLSSGRPTIRSESARTTGQALQTDRPTGPATPAPANRPARCRRDPRPRQGHRARGSARRRARSRDPRRGEGRRDRSAESRARSAEHARCGRRRQLHIGPARRPGGGGVRLRQARHPPDLDRRRVPARDPRGSPGPRERAAPLHPVGQAHPGPRPGDFPPRPRTIASCPLLERRPAAPDPKPSSSRRLSASRWRPGCARGRSLSSSARSTSSASAARSAGASRAAT